MDLRILVQQSLQQLLRFLLGPPPVPLSQSWENGAGATIEDAQCSSEDQGLEECIAHSHDDGPDDASPPAAPDPPSALQRLSPREREVLDLVCQGCSNQDIADRLTIAPATVHTHMHRLLRKLGLHNRWELRHWMQEQAGRDPA